MRKPLIAGNWKMYKTINEAVELANGAKRELLDFSEVDIVLCPPFTSLDSVYEVIMDTDIKLGAQNLYWQEEGAFTGEVSPIMLKDCGCEYVIIGHSERRKYFAETDETVNKKIKTALAVGLIPIVCVGETLKERESQKTIEVVQRQLQQGLKEIAKDTFSKIVIAYEPVWAIGTGKTATPQQAQEVHKFIRDWIEDNYSSDIAQKTRILYGGSVKPSNIEELMREEDIDGALVGGASLKVSSFVDITRNAVKIR
ncbi:MAG: triose-phosphate isomerase [Candidatus Omnitrophota bacterium]|nr:MAG: triose-phosphate isomerase [Candidatus Omnitrophota bacterium]